MGKRIYQNFEIRGRVYPDANAAGAALGVSPETVRLALRKGTQHRIGTGATGIEPMPVRLRGRVFPTAKAAATHFGVTPSSIYSAIERGRADRFGGPPAGVNAKAKAITLGNLTFPSMSEASRALGFKREFVSHAIRCGSKRGMQRILAAAMAESARRERVEGRA